MALDVHIVTHTHWDREWYHPLERFRQRLVALVDELIDDPPSSHESFLLDGQAIILEDYLAVRPDRADALRALLRDGRLEAGPWLVLADELIPTGEALVRNLLAGRRVLRRFGASPPPVLYCPDSFGHPAALPSIAAGFGLPVIILWRGYGGTRWPAGDTARWIAPNGDEALLFHLPRDGYEFGSHLPTEKSEAEQRWTRMRKELVSRSTTGVMLVPNGADHHARQRGFRDALAALEQAGEDDAAHRSSLRAFAERLLERSTAQRLPAVRGELRDSYGYTWTLQGTFGTRAHEKRLNARAERALLREAEPWSALAALAPLGRRSRRPLVEAAWHTLLEAHPHDTLCGCSIDEVAAAMELRLRSAMNQADGIRDDAIADLLGHDAVEARTARDRWTPVVVVRNAAPRARGGVAILDVEEFIADVAVGPGSAPKEIPAVAGGKKPTIPSLGALQVLSRGVTHSRTESPRHYPDNDLVAVTRVAAWIPPAPAYGLASYPIGSGDAKRGRPTQPVTVNERSLANASLAVAVAEDGTISLEHPGTERRIASLLELIDETDLGDTYTPSPRPRDEAVEFRGVKRVHRGPLRGELAVRYRLPDSADVAIHLILDADAPFLRIHVTGVNRGENHRLRLRVRGDVESDVFWADSAFGPVRRERVAVAKGDAAAEQPIQTAPMHRYVSLFGEAAGVTVYGDGFAEYEAASDGSITLTLVRAVGELSRNDLPERPGHAGWPVPTPAAQCLGPFEASFAVFLHGPRLAATLDAIEQTADDVLLPLIGSTLRSALSVPAAVTGVELIGVGLSVSAIKESEDGEGLVLRCVNVRDEEVAGSWRLPFAVKAAWLARLDETRMSELETEGPEVRFLAPPRGIVTIVIPRSAATRDLLTRESD